jgi:hypothetical protein
MPVPKNKPTTLSPEGSTSESASNIIPEQEEFRQYLRRLAVSAVQVLIEHVMREELDESHRSLVGRMHSHWSWLSQWVLYARSAHPNRAHGGAQSLKATGKGSFTARYSSATAAMNPRWPKRSHRWS